MNDWNIQSRSHTCSVCEQPFADKACYHTALFEDTDGLHRRDVCGGCWEAESQAALRSQPGFISHWQGLYEAPPPVSEAIHRENAETLLRTLIEQEDPRYIPAGYILAVMLERKRILKVKEELRREGRRVFVYEHAQGGEMLAIVDPGLQLDQLESVQREVSHLLEYGFNPPPAEPGVEALEMTDGEPEPVEDDGSRAPVT